MQQMPHGELLQVGLLSCQPFILGGVSSCCASSRRAEASLPIEGPCEQLH